MRIRTSLSLLLVGALSLSTLAGDRNKVVESKEAHARVQTLLSQISWHTEIGEALAAAEADGKLVFWMQLKGRLDGQT